MRRLVLDDDPIRHDWFAVRFPGIVASRTVSEALQWLGTGDWDELYLDHDLGTEPAVGRDVAKWLIERPTVMPELRIIVHSVNIVSGPKIERELRAAGRWAGGIPFDVLGNR